MKTDKLKPILKYGLGVAVLVYVIWSNWSPSNGNGLAAVWQKHYVEGQPIHSGPFLLACLIFLSSVLLTFYRWYILVSAQNLRFSIPDAMRLGLIGFAGSTFLPGSIGGDILKAAFLAREQSRRTAAVATVIIDRLIGLWGLAWLVVILGGIFWIGGFLTGQSATALQTIVLLASASVAGSMAIWFLVGWLPPNRAEIFAGRLERIPKVGHSAAEFWRALWMYRVKARSIFVALLLSVVGHVGFVLTFYFSALTLQDPDQIPSLIDHFLLIPIGMAIQAGFPTPGGVGGGEYAFGWLYTLAQFPAANGILGSLAQRVITWILAFGGYLVYLRMRPSLQGLTLNVDPKLKSEQVSVANT